MTQNDQVNSIDNQEVVIISKERFESLLKKEEELCRYLEKKKKQTEYQKLYQRRRLQTDPEFKAKRLRQSKECKIRKKLQKQSKYQLENQEEI